MIRQALEDHTKRFLRLAFDIREGEYERALLMQLNIFLVILSLLDSVENFAKRRLPMASA